MKPSPPRFVPKPYTPDAEREPTTGEYEVAAEYEAPAAMEYVKRKLGGRWFPKSRQAFLLSSLVAGLWAALDVASSDNLHAIGIALAFAKGAVGFMVTYLGLHSSGARRK